MEDYITKLLGLKGISISSSYEECGEEIRIGIETQAKYPICPECGVRVKRIHDYRIQDIRDVPYRNKVVHLQLKKRRYRCACGKRFYEKYPFLPRYHHMTQRVYESILKELEEPVTFKSVAKRYGISTNTVTRGCDLLDYNLHKLPEVLAIDEFKGNTDHEKYQGTLTNASNLRLLDILPTREKHYLVDYFRQFKREHVKYFVMDMWEPYKDIAETYFPNAMIVIDKYHYVRQVFWSLNQVRKRMQKTLSDKERLWFKRYRVFLEKPEWKLEPHQKRILEKMLFYDEDLYNAWQLKEIFYLYQMKNPDVAAKKLRVFIEMAKEIGLPEYKPTITAFTNWFEYIINAKRVPYTNAFTEGTHNKIKVLKRTGYGYQNYKRFRKRILHLA